MIFMYPKVLLLIILVFTLLFFYKNKKFQKIKNVFSKEILEKLEIVSSKVFGKNMRFTLSLVALIFMIIALARPIIPDSNDAKELQYQSFNLAVILDISKSMEAKDVFPSRLEFAKKSLATLMDGMSEANIAVIAYANDAFLVSPFSNDFKSINFLTQHLDSGSMSTNGSQILSALSATRKVFNSTEDKKRAVLLISDGADGLDIEKIGKSVKEHNFILHVLNIGTTQGISLEDGSGGLIKDKNGNIVISKRDDSIATIARNSGGAFLGLSANMSNLKELGEEIKASAQKKEMKKNKFDGAQELFYYPLILALFLFFFTFNSLRMLSYLVLIFVNQNLQAGLLDFKYKQEATTSYENKKYEKSVKSFEKLHFDEAIYDKGNALYKQNKFKEALEAYKSIKNFKDEKEFKRLYNMGNANAKLGKNDEAIKNYESALEINKNDNDAKFNLNLLQKQQEKKQQEEQNKQSSKNDKKKKNSEKNDSEKKGSKKDKDTNDAKQKNKDDQEKNSKETNNVEKQKDVKNEKDTAKQSKEEGQEKKMSEAEAKKWEKLMDKKDFTTKPYRLQKSENGEKNDISW